MMQFTKKYTLYLIHHSHTDIGYTETQERALKHQVSYIYQLLDYYDQASQNNISSDFKWNCETFVVIEEFLKTATEFDIARLKRQVILGNIEISASFANFAEILDPLIMERMIARAKDFALECNIAIKCAMQADVNGFGLGYAEAMLNNGIEFFFTEVHTHHGMFPLFKKQAPFYWQMKDGRKLLVWSGEHYMAGNALGFADGAIQNHAFDMDGIDDRAYNLNQANWLELAEQRLSNYIQRLELDNYQFDFVPIGISGQWTDNAMPNPNILQRVNEWNELFADEIEVKMVTLGEFYHHLAKQGGIETFEGDWPDWWTDGVGSAPRELKIFKNAQTKYEIIKSLDYEHLIINKERERSLDYDLALYAEHTYGAWSSVSNPYSSFANESWAGKQWYVFNAMRNLDKYYLELELLHGGRSSSFSRSNKFKIVNPNNHAIQEIIRLPFHSSARLYLTGAYEIHDQLQKYEYACDSGNYPLIQLNLAANESREIQVEFVDALPQRSERIPLYSRYQYGGSDGVNDCSYSPSIMHCQHHDNQIKLSESSIENIYYKIEWSTDGIIAWFDKELIVDLLINSSPAFAPIYEITKNTKRNFIGRNRKGIGVVRSVGKIFSLDILDRNIHFTKVCLKYSLDGCSVFENTLTLYNKIKRVDFTIKIAKHLVIEPESIYLALPFVKDKLHIDKKNSSIVPREYQLSGTLADFYSAFDGIAFINESYGVTVTTPDTQLIQYGDLEFRSRVLSGDPQLSTLPTNVYIWLMNNIWETNFIVNLANFYEFEFSVSSSAKFKSAEIAMDYLHAVVKKPLVVNIFK